MATARISESLTGDKLYQRRAREALPLLVRQAYAGEPITYENLAAELGMPNPRNLNYVLVSVGQSMIAVGKHWQIEVPPIQCLVINKNSGLPGEGISEFFGTLADYRKLSKRQRRQVVDAELAKIYGFSRWAEVLEFFGLSPTAPDFHVLVDQARERRGGESEAHKALKAYIAKYPQVVGLPPTLSPGEQEYALPSGDFVDVFFDLRGEHIGIEVKPASSDDVDITRGLYQCIKYQAVLEAVQGANGQAKNVRTVLVLAGALSRPLIALKNVLDVDVIDGVQVPRT
jgi:hypothetical protein